MSRPFANFLVGASRFSSEAEMQAKLELPRRKHVGSNLPGSSNADLSVAGRTVVLNVERIKEFRPERGQKSFTNWEILEH